MNRENVSSKSFLATVLLALFGGVWGLHRFYCGKILTAVLQLFLWIFSIVKIFYGYFRAYSMYFMNIERYFYLSSSVTQERIAVNFLKEFVSKTGKLALIGMAVVSIWVIVDLITIVCRRFKDKEGKVISPKKAR